MILPCKCSTVFLLCVLDLCSSFFGQNQVKASVYGDGIPFYQHRFKLFHTYLSRNIRVHRSTLRYERPFHSYEWIIDKETTVDSIDNDNLDQTIVDPFDPDDSDENELPPPTIVNISSFRYSCATSLLDLAGAT